MTAVAAVLRREPTFALDPLAVSFVESLASDLRAAGVEARVHVADGTVFALALAPGSGIDESRVCEIQRESASELFRHVAKSPTMAQLLPAGRLVDPSRIVPVVKMCNSRCG